VVAAEVEDLYPRSPLLHRPPYQQTQTQIWYVFFFVDALICRMQLTICVIYVNMYRNRQGVNLFVFIHVNIRVSGL
jgi:hypothetical protein